MYVMNTSESAQRMVALVESLEFVDALYGITAEERRVLNVLHGIKDFAEED